MQELIAAVAVIGIPLVIAGGFAVLATRARRRGTSGGLMGVFEQMWDPAAHRMGEDTVAREERTAPAPLPGDPPRLV
ncbi:hypothetical protein ACQEVB_09525 [Pseudonocardia sp. CA-107938]|uniref:hypothetical protein n=1 Tax=Pseudonocardia sp. CA-107938 TaxID=3240021 RepID=UPI003D90C94E